MLEPTDKASQQAFYSHFQASRADLAAQLEASRNNPRSDNDWEELALNIRKLRKSLTDATSLLPAYDQRQCQAQMDQLEQTLEGIRSASVPKLKFAFKRKTNKPPLSATPTPSPSSHDTNMHGERDSLPQAVMSTFHKISSHSHNRLSLQSIPTFGADSPSSDLTISDLDHCIVDLCSTAPLQNKLPLTALHVRDLNETILVLPNVKGSVLLHNLHKCTVIVACQQFRMHNSIDVHVYLASISSPIIENCSAIAFAGYPSFVSLLSPSAVEALPPNGKHTDVQDFSHIRPTPSPNWVVLPPGNENWDDLLTLDGSSPQEVDVILAAHLPEATYSNIV
ncbi:tubulin binding cofactor C-domain-containing protein [Lactifluus subvellereus]|nr:tubulin binding cofactor C-domain-containing protein [Lactifluus subvellereus]